MYYLKVAAVAFPMISSYANQAYALDNTLSYTVLAGVGNGVDVYFQGYQTSLVGAAADGSAIAVSDNESLLNVWTPVSDASAGDDVYRLLNKFTGLYMAKTDASAQNQPMAMVKDKAEAGRFRIAAVNYCGATYFTLTDIDNSGTKTKMVNVSDEGVVQNSTLYDGTITRTGCLFTLLDPTEDKVNAALALTNRYTDNYTGYHQSGIDFVGDIKATEASESAYETLTAAASRGDVDIDDYVALNDIVTADMAEPMHSERRVQIIPGHYYHIESPYGAFTEQAIAETYYAKDYSTKQNCQRVHFTAWDEYTRITVPTFWLFERQEAKNGTDADGYYKIVAANSGKALRRTGADAIIDMQDADDSFVGIYSYQKEDNLIVYDHAVTLLSHVDNDAREVRGHLATSYDEIYDDYDLRDGEAVCPATDKKVDGANNWRLHEITQLTLKFPQPTVTRVLDPETNEVVTVEYTGSCYRSICLPFAIQIPSNAKAYSALDRLSLYGNEAFELAEITVKDGGTVSRNIVPANTPAIIVARGDQEISFPILYDDKHTPVIFSLVGTLAPSEVPDGDVIYVVDDLNDEHGHTENFVRKIGGTDYSYDTDETSGTRAADVPAYSIMNSKATYILDANHAYLKAASADEPEVKTATISQRVTTSRVDVATDNVDQTSTYFDLSGRRVERPVHGIYVRQDGVKILVP